MECVVCGTKIGKKARTCSAKCKQIAYRNRQDASTVTTVTPATVTKPTVTKQTLTKPTVTNLELCQYCGEPLPKLAKPRRWQYWRVLSLRYQAAAQVKYRGAGRASVCR